MKRIKDILEGHLLWQMSFLHYGIVFLLVNPLYLCFDENK